MESYPPEFAQAVTALVKAAAQWASADAVGAGDVAEERMAQVEEQYQQLSEINAYNDDPIQIKDMACAAGSVTAAQMLLDAEDLDERQQSFTDAVNPTPEGVSQSLWLRTQKLCWAAAKSACAEEKRDDQLAQQAGREFDRHSRSLAGFGPGARPADRSAYAQKAREVMPGTVIMFSGCQDDQTSADVYNTSSFGLPSDAGPGGAGGACTNSMVKALLQGGDFTWVSLLQAMRQILDGQYTQIPQLCSSREMDLNSPFTVTNPEPSGNFKALMIGINYVGSSAELRGCHNDVDTMMRYLNSHGYDESGMRILCDDGQHENPTKQNIMDGMSWLVEGASAGDSLFFHYSGHGASVRDDDGDEADGKDECLVPVDYNEGAGLLRDDDVFKLLVAPLGDGVTLTCVLDCCHSGTILDLPYMFKADDASLQGVQDGSVGMSENPDFDFGKVLEVIKKHPGLCAAAAVAGGTAFACMPAEQKQEAMGFMMNMAKSFFS